MAKFIPKGWTRLCSLIPIIFIFLYLPLNINSFFLGSITSFFISWLANFKLVLFAFDKGPLSGLNNLSFGGFLLLACLPIRINDQERSERGISSQDRKLESSSTLRHVAVKTLLLAVINGLYLFCRELIHPKLMLLINWFIIFVSLELLLALPDALARALTRLKIGPAFVDPHLASSLQNFWGRRWNLVVVSVLRPTVYERVRSTARSLVGPKWAYFPAVVATFLVSGLMHELLFYHVRRMKPTWGMTSIFLLHGVCVAVEISVKKEFKGRFSVPRVLSGPLVVLFAAFTNYEILTIVPVGRELTGIFDLIKIIFC